MDAHTLLEEWQGSPFSGRNGGLCDLQSRRASGAVDAGGSVLFLREGDPVAVVEDLAGQPRPGDPDALERTDGELHEADHPQAATLGAMLALDGDVRGRYFTDDTPLSAVRETLSEGGFTGYVELADNVLSGDYYVVYRDGDEEFVAFVGPSNQVLVGEEARSRAEDEVGIYSVVAVDLPDVELPEPAPTEDSASGSAGASTGAGPSTGAGASGRSDAEESASAVGGDDGAGGEDQPASEGPSAVDARMTDDDPSAGEASASATTDPAIEGESPADDGGSDGGSSDDGIPTGVETAAGDAVGPGGDVESGEEAGAVDESGHAVDRTNGGTTADGSGAGAPSAVDVTDDPDPGGRAESGTGAPRAAGDGDADTIGTDVDGTDSVGADADGADADGADAGAPDAARSDVVPVTHDTDDTAAGDDRAEEPDGLETLRAEVQALREERDELQRRVDSLEDGGGVSDGGVSAGGVSEGRAREGEAGGTGGVDTGAGRALDPAEALGGTSLFVRTDSRGGATLEAARDGEVGREELAQNVRIEYHTTFDDAAATVDGRPFGEWLRATPQYRFLRWVVVELPFEIRETGSAPAMRSLYDALPNIDRVGLDDAIAAGDGEERREVTFDVVARDQMGDPLFVATIDVGRDPTAGDALAQLVTDVTEVSAAHASLAATFAVTSSYFEPAALKAVREATSGSLLRRERRASYVKLSRRNGFHVCLVERREDAFHLTVPEL